MQKRLLLSICLLLFSSVNPQNPRDSLYLVTNSSPVKKTSMETALDRAKSQHAAFVEDCLNRQVSQSNCSEWSKLNDYQKACAPFDSSGAARPVEQIMYSFCSQPKVESRFGLTINSSSSELNLLNLDNMEDLIRNNHGFRKRCIRPLEKRFGKGYINELISKYRTFLYNSIREREEQKRKKEELIKKQKEEERQKYFQKIAAENKRVFEIRQKRQAEKDAKLAKEKADLEAAKAFSKKQDAINERIRRGNVRRGLMYEGNQNPSEDDITRRLKEIDGASIVNTSNKPEQRFHNILMNRRPVTMKVHSGNVATTNGRIIRPVPVIPRSEIKIVQSPPVEKQTTGNRISNRAAALQEVSKHSDITSKKSFVVNDSAKLYAKDFISIESLQSADGNAIQLNIHSDVVDIVNETSNFLHRNKNDFYIINYSHMIYGFTDSALKFSLAKEYKKAYSVTDFCWDLLGAIKEAPKRAAERVLNFYKDFVCHPLDTSKNIVLGLFDLAYEFFTKLRKLSGVCLEGMDDFATPHEWSEYVKLRERIDPIERDREVERIKAFCTNIVKFVQEKPQEALTEAMSIPIEFVLQGALLRAGILSASKIIEPTLKIFKEEIGALGKCTHATKPAFAEIVKESCASLESELMRSNVCAKIGSKNFLSNSP